VLCRRPSVQRGGLHHAARQIHRSAHRLHDEHVTPGGYNESRYSRARRRELRHREKLPAAMRQWRWTRLNPGVDESGAGLARRR
jgi:hypothetical protein